MSTKKRIEKIDTAWQQKAATEGKPLVIVKCEPRGKVEKIRGIQI